VGVDDVGSEALEVALDLAPAGAERVPQRGPREPRQPVDGDALPAGRLAAIWRNRLDRTATVEAEPSLDVALDRALAGPPGPIVVAGSLYLVGAIRARLVDDPLLRDPVDNRP